MAHEQLLTVTEAADRLNLHRTTVHGLIRTEALPSVKIGRSRRIRVADLDDYVRSLPMVGA